MKRDVPFFRIQPLTNRYAYLWLKYVRGFNPNVHCTRCLIGHFSRIIPFRKIPAGTLMEGYMDEVNYNCIYYLCGVTNAYDDNLHIAFKYEKGGEVIYENKLVKVHITEAVQIPIEPITEHIDKGDNFRFCRNYMLAFNYFGTKKLGTQTSLEYELCSLFPSKHEKAGTIWAWLRSPAISC